MAKKSILTAAVVMMSASPTAKSEINMPTRTQAPVAQKKPMKLTQHGDTRVDDYYWLRDDSRQNQEVLNYLHQENDYTEAMLSHTVKLQQTLYQEMVGRLQQNDQSVPYKKKDYWYSHRFHEGKEHPILVRNKGNLQAPDELLLDANERAKGHDYYNLGDTAISHDQKWMAFSEDTQSRRLYTIHIKDLQSSRIVDDVLTGTSGCMVWANDNKTLYYVKKDPQTLLPNQVFKHVIGTPQAEDVLVYEEKDPSYYVSLHKSTSEDYIVIGMYATESSEARFIDANQPNGEVEVFKPRDAKVEYTLDHFKGRFMVKTNRTGKNFALFSVTPEQRHDLSQWQELAAAQQDVLLQTYELFDDWLVLEERVNGLVQLRQVHWQTGKQKKIEFNDPTYTAWVSFNPDTSSNKLRYGYTSLTTPTSTFEVDLNTDTQTTLKQQVVNGEFDPDLYQSERVWVDARDGTKVPVSLVYRQDTFKKDGANPLLLYAYGSYGSSEDAVFSSEFLSLLDRGFVYAIAHVRGGEELGRQWYEDGKLQNKQNTFNDFIDVTQALTKQGYGDKQKVFAMGGSAGGLLMGVVANEAPELYKGVVAQVPFVDVVTTMSDDSIPLTTGEYDEWGNPANSDDYHYIKAYSPYDQVKSQTYPNMLVTTGLHDSQVQYWEPAKWVAKLRDLKQGDNMLLLDVDMETGHGGKSGRFQQYLDTAKEYAFILDLAGIKQ